jgi:hypothetical protein
MKKLCLDKQFNITKALLLIFLVIGLVSSSNARQFRLISPIASPEEANIQLPTNAKPVEDVQPLSRRDVEPLIKDVIAKWNTPEMSSTLSDQFYDKSRLMDVMDTGVPRDATVRIQGIRGIQTLQQYIVPNPDRGRDEMVSIVSATVQTQIEFNTRTGGFTTLPGANELILKITSAVPP